ncbi:MAG: HAD family phosphatase [Bacteroidetes bacterium]|nr:HAD family phosphatase [Bacteroidota bacterium]
MLINTKNYKNIIFDLGGVIINIDYSLVVKAFADLGILNFDELYSQAHQNNLFDNLEKGKISAAEFRKEIRRCCNKNLTDEQIDHAWNAILLDIPAARLKLLQQLKKTHRTFLLSNTNEIHMVAIDKYLQQTYGVPDLSGYFEKKYLSYEVGMRKPDAEIFELVLAENNLNPSETLFIEDSIQHIEAAKRLGIQTHWLQKGEEVLDLGLV